MERGQLFNQSLILPIPYLSRILLFPALAATSRKTPLPADVIGTHSIKLTFINESNIAENLVIFIRS